jgi:hypothetical protein
VNDVKQVEQVHRQVEVIQQGGWLQVVVGEVGGGAVQQVHFVFPFCSPFCRNVNRKATKILTCRTIFSPWP